MFAMVFLLAEPNTSLGWLFYILLAFLALVIIVGALSSRDKTEPASKAGIETEERAAQPGFPEKVKRTSSRKKSK